MSWEQVSGRGVGLAPKDHWTGPRVERRSTPTFVKYEHYSGGRLRLRKEAATGSLLGPGYRGPCDPKSVFVIVETVKKGLE